MVYILVVDDDPEESPSTTYFDAVTTPNAESGGLLGGYPIKSFGHMHST